MKNPSLERNKRLVKAGLSFERLKATPEWSMLAEEMAKELQRLNQLSEEPGFLKEVANNPIVLADNLSFRRGIRYVIDYPERVFKAGKSAVRAIEEAKSKPKAKDRLPNPERT